MHWLLHPNLCAWEELYEKRAALTVSTTTPGKIAKKSRIESEGGGAGGDEGHEDHNDTTPHGSSSPTGGPVPKKLFQD